MVFCRQCNRQVEDCEHCAFPIAGQRVPVTDAKVATLTYCAADRILEIAFRSGQVWQLSHVPEGIFRELCDATVSSFLKFIAQRYTAVPVKTGVHAIRIPSIERCGKCRGPMKEGHRTISTSDRMIRVRWDCAPCDGKEWRTYRAADRPAGQPKAG
jgi:hypothetical protein